MMKKVLLLTIFILTIFVSQAQNTGSTYRTALGVKVWDGGGISLKHFLNGNNAGELIAYFNRRGFRLTGLYEIHGNISGASGLKWYIGPGAHIGFYDAKYDEDRTVVGVDGVLGLDYKFRGAPINMSIDWQPSLEFGDDRGLRHLGGLGIRYTF